MGISVRLWFLGSLTGLRWTCIVFWIRLPVLWLTHLAKFIIWEEQIMGLTVCLYLFIQLHWPLYRSIRHVYFCLSCCIGLTWRTLHLWIAKLTELVDCQVPSWSLSIKCKCRLTSLLLLPFHWKLQPKAARCGIGLIFSLLWAGTNSNR